MVRKDRPNVWIWMGKVLLAGVIALIVLTLFCMGYDNTPVHHTDEDGATDNRWEGNSLYIKCTEGFNYDRYNNEGYKNPYDYYDGLDIDILMMGCSHLEGNAIPRDDVVSNRLHELLSDATVYNIGMDGHSLLCCAGNIQAAMSKYQPKEYVIMELPEVYFNDQDLQQVLDGTYPERPSYSGGLIGLLQHNQFLRCIYHQLTGLEKARALANEDLNASSASELSDPALLSQVMALFSGAVIDEGARPIFVYHPALTLEHDGSITFSSTPVEEDAFAALCEKNGILFLNMRDRFQAEYDQNHILPYGFTNTAVGTAHLNRYGHEMMAEELCKLIQEVGT